MSQKYHGMICACKSIQSIASELSRRFKSGIGVTHFENNSRIKFEMELYQMRADLSSYMFLSRSLLDQFSILIQFLTGPKSKLYSSFTDVMKKAKKNPPPDELDSELCNYLKNECSWKKKRDVD